MRTLAAGYARALAPWGLYLTNKGLVKATIATVVSNCCSFGGLTVEIFSTNAPAHRDNRREFACKRLLTG